MPALVVRSTRVILPEGARAAALYIDHGVIDRIADYETDDPANADVLDAADLVVSPGLVDTHVHVNEPGRTEWEGFDTATRAAAAGGVTTIVDMPLNSIPATTTVDALRAKREAAHARCHVDVAFWGGVVPGNANELDALVDAGVRGFKSFLTPSGVAEFPAVTEEDLRQALPILARRNVPLLVHAEDPKWVTTPAYQPRPPDPPHQPYEPYLSSRPAVAELDAVRLMIRLSAEFQARVHIVHVSSAEAVDAIAAAKAARVPITAETCPHYLMFAADEIPDGATEFKCAPPIRERSHRDALWAGLETGALDLIATDHSPAPPALKTPGNFATAWGGIASLELSLSVVARAFQTRDRGPQRAAPHKPETAARQIARWMSAAPAALAGLGDRKGRIAPGLDADLVIWDPDATFPVVPERLQQRHKLTPYAGRTLSGRVVTTLVRGERVWGADRLTRACGGRLL
jgi:allantoinase